MGLARGRTIFTRYLSSVQPSSEADSYRSNGMDDCMYVRAITTLYTLIAPGSSMAQTVFIMPKSRTSR